MELTAKKLQLALACSPATAERWVEALGEACSVYGIEFLPRTAAYLAQIGHESEGLEKLAERLSYSPQRLREVCQAARAGSRWRSLLPRVDELARNPVGLGNAVYGGRMGNGPEVSGDGYRYRARGPIGITGRGNMAAVTQLLGKKLGDVPNFVREPELLETPKWGAFSAAALWSDWGLNTLADAGNDLAISRRINLGDAKSTVTPNGWSDRHARYIRALRVLA
ncbi:glycoside hydrolase family 19 protein [Xanthomonas theicola]|uniref:DNA primase n=1 Tax=Xanthomonas theicola TaxID=56464 RepID=A0A2S6ZDT3_9XANT|nr:glycoside hydrolase family 19 protein [Xanthomonas theicola]PPT90433.1 DNA primase [Xanthomonas theicola]QNH24802.1 glycoside hydrolase family 19 protein [Xanthomonas theicola]